MNGRAQKDRSPAPAERPPIAELAPALVMLLLLTVVTGVLYPLAVTGLAQAVFPREANGSLLVRDGHVVGSSWIGQSFTDPGHFWGRLSATSPAYHAGASSGSNYGPLHPALADAARGRIEALRAADPSATGPVPVDLVTASGSGLDPHVSPAAAEFQLARVARVRDVDPDTLRALVARHTAPRLLGFIGEPVVNVLELNLALDERDRRASR